MKDRPKVPTVAEYLRDELEAREWTSDDFAKELFWPIGEVDNLLDDRLPITGEIAQDLASVFNTSVEVWLNLYNAGLYDADKAHCRAVAEWRKENTADAAPREGDGAGTPSTHGG